MGYARDKLIRVAVAALATAAISVAVGACGSSSTQPSAANGSPAGTGTRGTSPTDATTKTAGGSPTPTSSTQTSTQPAMAGICRASELSPSFLGERIPMQNEELGFALRNTSSQSCTTYGYPGILFLGSDGAALPTRPTRTTDDPFGPTPAHSLTVPPGSSVSFRLWVQGVITGRAGCTMAHGLQVIPPNDTATLRVPIPGGAWECAATTVSPVQPGTTAYP